MQRSARIPKKMDDRIAFLREFLKNPRQVASIIPSSRFLERRIVELAGIPSAQTIVDLGAGTGGTTRAILDAMPPRARLLSIEINQRFCDLLGRIDDTRLTAHCGSAHELRKILSIYNLPAPDVVISGIPFSTISHTVGTRILEAISSALVPGGRFVAYQISRQVEELSQPLFGPAQVAVEFLNIPPLRLYRWEKHTTASPTDRFRGVDSTTKHQTSTISDN
jgi:phosphatidylethanolamine/phosphatidyl-N-methylethanolamine N-methyltransferase